MALRIVHTADVSQILASLDKHASVVLSTAVFRPDQVVIRPGGMLDSWSILSVEWPGVGMPIITARRGEQRIRIGSAAMWTGGAVGSPLVVERALLGLETRLRKVVAFGHRGIGLTPGRTGRDLLAASIPGGLPVALSQETRELIHTTSGQGRIEVMPARIGGFDRGALGVLGEGMTVMDARLAYPALTWGMPSGVETWWSGRSFEVAAKESHRRRDGFEISGSDRLFAGRGRWHVRTTVPDTWEAGMPGLLPFLDGGHWTWPATPGRVFETWCDGSELWLASRRGWPIEVLEGVSWRESHVLDRWSSILLSIWRDAVDSDATASRVPGDGEPTPARLASRMIRAMLNQTIGSFARRDRLVSRSVPITEARLIPTGVEVEHAGDLLVWSERVELRPQEQTSQHPEWAATIWARARTRLLSAPGGAGALSIDPARLIGFDTDAIYLAGTVPDWPDDGTPGRFRPKAHRDSSFTWPTTVTEMRGLIS